MGILKKRWIYIINGFIVFLFMGCGLAWSVFMIPVEEAFGWTRDQTSLAFTANILCFSVGSILTGILSKRFSFSTLLKISAIMMGLGFFGAGFISAPWHLYLTYGIIVGTGIGLGYNCVLSACPLWLPERAATATGILLMGYALSTAVFGPLLNSLIDSIGIISTFKTLAIVCGGGIFLGSFLLKIPSIEEMNQLPQVDRHEGKQEYNVVTSKMIRKPIFWVYYLVTVLLGGLGLVIINHCSPILTEGLAVSAAFSALVISIASISNGVGRVLWGLVYDKFGVIKTLFLIGACFTIASVGLFLSYSLNIVFIFIISDCLLMFSYAGNAVTCPSVIRTLFGHRTFSLNYSVLATDAVFTSIFPSIAGVIQLATGNYHIPLLLLIVIGVVAILTICILTKLYKKEYV